MRILVIEDEVMVARNLCRMIREALERPDQTIHHVLCLEEARRYIETNSVDLVFLDLNLSGEDGFDLLSGLVAQSFQTIVASANTDQALRSYEYGVVDFIPKPFKLARLKAALDKVCFPIEQAESGVGQAKYLGIRNTGDTRLVQVNAITHIDALGRYSEIVLEGGGTHLHEKNLKQLLLVLPECFQRVHKSHVINMHFAERIVTQPGSKYEIRLKDGQFLPIGRKYLPHLRTRLE